MNDFLFLFRVDALRTESGKPSEECSCVIPLGYLMKMCVEKCTLLDVCVEKRDEHVTCISSKMRRKRKWNESASSRSALGPSRIPRVRDVSWNLGNRSPLILVVSRAWKVRHSVPILVLFVVKRPKISVSCTKIWEPLVFLFVKRPKISAQKRC